ncbi:MAG: hypothetical protein GY719_06580 [bacterium]|nr:hypothetical protein [bacterium]
MSGKRNEEDCLPVEPLLDDLVDGHLTVDDHQRVRTHLDVCDACAERLRSLEALLAEVDALPRGVEPPADLWPAIEPRLTAREARSVMPHWPAWARQAAAAVAFMALGGVLSQVLLPGGGGGGGTPDRAGEVTVVEGPVDPMARSDIAEAHFALAEADYLHAKEALWGAVYSSRDKVSPATREVVERNLRVIDGAIRELRSALENDPGNPDLESLLLAQHRTEIGLLQRLARTTEV